MKQFKLFLLLFFILLFQGTVMPLILESRNLAHIQMVPEFLLIILLMTALFGHFSWGMRYALIFGLLIDMIFSQILGVHAFAMALSVYLTYQLSRWININIATTLLLTSAGVIVNQVIAYLIYQMIGLTDQNLLFFLYNHLLPTLLLNAAFSIILYYPVRRFMDSSL
ncbi:MAG: rod shape-determining protein MreD [Sporolactobacillus sp.]